MLNIILAILLWRKLVTISTEFQGQLDRLASEVAALRQDRDAAIAAAVSAAQAEDTAALSAALDSAFPAPMEPSVEEVPETPAGNVEEVPETPAGNDSEAGAPTV